jgi:hypothetical protein
MCAWQLVMWGFGFVRVSRSAADQSAKDFPQLRDALSSHLAHIGDLYELADVASARRELEMAKAIESELSCAATLTPATAADGARGANGR